MAQPTQTTTRANGGPVAQPAQSKGALATIKDARLPYHPAIQERYGIDEASWRALTDAVFPAAKTTAAVDLALSYCKARKLDPFKRVVHIVPIYDREAKKWIETVWPGIAEHRTTAFRTNQYAGADAAQYGETKTKVFNGTDKDDRPVNATVSYPEWCQLTVYRLIGGQRVPIPGPRVYWLETYSKASHFTEVPNDRWKRAPFQMIEKCAEAAALRRAFPEELGGEPTAEEIDGGDHHEVGATVVDVTPAAPARPTRQEFTGAGHEDLDAKFRQTMGHNADTGEVIEQKPAAEIGSDDDTAPASGAPATEAGLAVYEAQMADCTTTKQLKDLYFSDELKPYRDADPQGSQAAYNHHWDRIKGAK